MILDQLETPAVQKSFLIQQLEGQSDPGVQSVPLWFSQPRIKRCKLDILKFSVEYLIHF